VFVVSCAFREAHTVVLRAVCQLPCPTRADALVEGGACTPFRRVGLTRSKSACDAGPDASGNLTVGVLHSPPCRTRETDGHVASRLLRRTRPRGRLTATRPCRETHPGLVGTPVLSDCLWPVMDSLRVVAPGWKPSHALLPSLLTRFARSVEEGDSALPLQLISFCCYVREWSPSSVTATAQPLRTARRVSRL
jgi:hypothetical protein